MIHPRDDRRLRCIARRMLPQAADREDAVQDTWLASLSSGVRPADHEQWMAGVARNRCLRIWDSRRRAEEQQHTLEPRELMIDPEVEVDRVLLRELLLATVALLSRPQARVVRLHYFEDVSLAEIAGRTGWPLGTVKSHLARGLAELRLRLAARLGPDAAGEAAPHREGAPRFAPRERTARTAG